MRTKYQKLLLLRFLYVVIFCLSGFFGLGCAGPGSTASEPEIPKPIKGTVLSASLLSQVHLMAGKIDVTISQFDILVASESNVSARAVIVESQDHKVQLVQTSEGIAASGLTPESLTTDGRASLDSKSLIAMSRRELLMSDAKFVEYIAARTSLLTLNMESIGKQVRLFNFRQLWGFRHMPVWPALVDLALQNRMSIYFSLIDIRLNAQNRNEFYLVIDLQNGKISTAPKAASSYENGNGERPLMIAFNPQSPEGVLHSDSYFLDFSAFYVSCLENPSSVYSLKDFKTLSVVDRTKFLGPDYNLNTVNLDKELDERLYGISKQNLDFENTAHDEYWERFFGIAKEKK